MRFVLAGAALVFAGFAILGAFGGEARAAVIESAEFGTCGGERDCGPSLAGRALFFATVAGLVGAGVIFLAKGARGDWDSKVKPEDAVGPGRRD